MDFPEEEVSELKWSLLGTCGSSPQNSSLQTETKEDDSAAGQIPAHPAPVEVSEKQQCLFLTAWLTDTFFN